MTHRNNDGRESVEISPREWERVLEVLEDMTREIQLNREDIIVLKTKFAMAGIISGLVSSAVTSIVVAILLFWLKVK